MRSSERAARCTPAQRSPRTGIEAMEHFDIVIRGGTVVDGTGMPGVRADVAVSGDRIVAVGDIGPTRTAIEIDAAGQVVAPGVIDAHTTNDRQLLSDRATSAKVSQGVT